MESPNPPPRKPSYEAEELDTEVPTLLEDLAASGRRLTGNLHRGLTPMRARPTVPIRPGSWLGVTILGLNLGLFLLALRDAASCSRLRLWEHSGVSSGWHGRR